MCGSPSESCFQSLKLRLHDMKVRGVLGEGVAATVLRDSVVWSSPVCAISSNVPSGLVLDLSYS